MITSTKILETSTTARPKFISMHACYASHVYSRCYWSGPGELFYQNSRTTPLASSLRSAVKLHLHQHDSLAPKNTLALWISKKCRRCDSPQEVPTYCCIDTLTLEHRNDFIKWTNKGIWYLSHNLRGVWTINAHKNNGSTKGSSSAEEVTAGTSFASHSYERTS
jgi:hypothetical protein